MKTVISLLIVAAYVHANSIARYGWTPGTESFYRFESQLLSGIPEIRNTQYAGFKLRAKVGVQASQDYQLRIKISNPRFITFNGEVSLTEAGRVIKDGGSQANKRINYPQDFRSFLEKPFLVDLKKGLVTGFHVPQNEPESITNIKRSLLSQLQLDLSSSQMMDPNHGSLQQAPHNVMEQSVGGECQTMYNVVRMTPARVMELEREWEKEEVDAQIPLSTGGKAVCNGKPYYEITKTKNLNNCQQRPVYQHVTGANLNADASESHVGNMMVHKIASVTYVCGELSSFDVRKIAAYDTIVKNPVGYNTDQTLKIASRVMLELMKKKSISQKLPMPAQTREVKTLVYSYQRPSTQRMSNEGLTKDIVGVSPILPQPNLEDATTAFMPIEVHKTQMIRQMVSTMGKINRQVLENPESIRASQDISGKLRSISKSLELLSMDELEQFWKKVIGSTAPSSQQAVKGLLLDVIAMVGTNPSTVFILESVRTELKLIGAPTLNSVKLSEVIQSTIKSIKTPTTELVVELIDLVNKLKAGRSDREEQLLTSTLLQVSNLLHNAYVNPSSMVTRFPVRIYGIFGTEESNVLKGKYIPLLKEMHQVSKQSANKHRSLVIISALGKLGHLDAAEVLVKVAQGQNQEEPMVRVLAVQSLKRTARKYPNVLKPILLAIINNPVEHPDVRIAAIDILPWTHPSYAELQNIAVRSWYDTSNQVSSFAHSTFESLANTQDPELKTVGIKAKGILHMFKPTSYGFQYSKNIHLEKFVRYLLSSVSSKYSYTATKEPEAISRLSLKTDVLTDALGKGLRVNLQNFNIYSQGLERATDYALVLSGYLSDVKPAVQAELIKITNQINLETRKSPPFMAFVEYSALGNHYAGSITPEGLIEMALNTKPNARGEYSGTFISVINPLSTEIIMPTETGLQITGRIQNPIFFMAKLNVSWDISVISQPKAELSVFPLASGKTEANCMIVSPFSGSGYPPSGEFIGTGVSMGLHIASPVEVDMSLGKGKVDIKLKAPEEVLAKPVEIDVVAGYVSPFTFRKDLKSVEPDDNKAHDLKSIRSGDRLKKVDQRLDSYLNGQFKYESDNKFNDLDSYWEKIKENSLDSLMNVYSFMSSIRYSSARLSINPSYSEIKHAQIQLDIWARQPNMVMSKVSKPVDSAIEQEVITKSSNSLSNVISSLKTAPETIIKLQASIKGASLDKTIEGFSVFGNEASTDITSQVKSHVGAVVTMDHGQVYGIIFNGNLTIPSLHGRWDNELILEQPLEAKLDGKLVYGSLNIQMPNMRTIRLKSVLRKTKRQISWVGQSPDFRECHRQYRVDRRLSPICIKARHEAASLDQIHLNFNVSPDMYSNPAFPMIEEFFKAYMLPYYRPMLSYQNIPEGNLEMIMDFAPHGDIAQVNVRHHNDAYTLQNVRIPAFVQGIMPISARNHVGDWIEQKATNNYDPASCRIEPGHVSTFDNKTYSYEMNNCEHVLMMDGSSTIPVAVLARTVPGKGRALRVLAPKMILEIVPEGNSLTLMINGVNRAISPGQIFVEKDSLTTEVIAEIKHFQDRVYHVYVPNLLDVITDGKRIEVVASQLVRGRAVGLCGDMNGEKVADVTSPRKCVMSPKSAAISYMLRSKSAHAVPTSCERNIPAQDLLNFQREEQKCVKDKVVPTLIVPMFEKLKASIGI